MERELATLWAPHGHGRTRRGGAGHAAQRLPPMPWLGPHGVHKGWGQHTGPWALWARSPGADRHLAAQGPPLLPETRAHPDSEGTRPLCLQTQAEPARRGEDGALCSLRGGRALPWCQRSTAATVQGRWPVFWAAFGKLSFG